MRTIAVTGRSGCGKSSVTAVLARRGYAIVDADKIAREVLFPGSVCIAQLKERFGADIVNADGVLERRLLADRAFQTPQGTRALTDITFPEIHRRILALAHAAEKRGEHLFFIDGAVIVGTPFEALCNAIILVSAPYETSVARIAARDGIAPAMARRRLDAQTPVEILRAASTFEIVNDGLPEALEPKVAAVLQALDRGE